MPGGIAPERKYFVPAVCVRGRSGPKNSRPEWLLILFVGLCAAGAGGCHERVPDAAAPPRARNTAAERMADKQQALGDEYLRQDRRREALAAWRLALELDPGRTALARRVTDLENGRVVPPAIPAGGGPAGGLDLPPGLDPRLAQMLKQAEAHYRRNELREAEEAWRTALALDPGQDLARAGLARLAEEVYQEDADRPFDHMTRELYQEGLRAYRLQAWAQAEVKLAEAAKLNPGQPQVKQYLERTRHELEQVRAREQGSRLAEQARQAETAGDWFAAYGLWTRAGALTPPPAAAAEGQRRTQPKAEDLARKILKQAAQDLRQGRIPAAQAAYARVLTAFPQEPEAVRGAAQARAALQSRGREEKAKSETRQFVQSGETCYRQGDYAGAQRAWEKAAAADPGNPELRQLVERARRQQAEVTAQNRRRAQARYEDGLAAYQRGELDEALAAWQETLELDPENEKARANLRRLSQETR